MKGVTIIEEHLCRVVGLPELIGGGLFVTALFIGVLLLYRFIYKHGDKSIKPVTWLCSTAIVIIYLVFWAVMIPKYNSTHYEYTVEVDDSVSFNEFFDKYEIVSTDGNRYRVKDIND